jgi:hypothetical protein
MAKEIQIIHMQGTQTEREAISGATDKLIIWHEPDGAIWQSHATGWTQTHAAGGALLVSIGGSSGGGITPNPAYDADQAVTEAGVLVSIPAGAETVEIGMVSGTIAVRAAFGDAAVLASATEGVRVPGIAAGTNPVPARVYNVPEGATSMHLITESAGTSTISIAWGT